MRKLIVTAMCLIAVFVGTTNAQKKTESISPVFSPGWYIGANGGLNLFMGEGNNFLNGILGNNKPYVFNLKDNGAFLGRAVLGYNFTPVIGLRGMLGYVGTSWPNASIPSYKFGSENLTADVVFNLSNTNNRYNSNRKFDFSLFVGLGAGYRNSLVMDNLTPLSGILRGGLQGDYKLSPALAINLILEGNITTDNYNDLALGPLPFDVFPALTVGLTYRLPEKKEKIISDIVTPVETVIPPVVVPPTIVAKIDTPKVKAVELVVEQPKVAVVEPAKIVEPKETEPEAVLSGELNQHIFFTLNQRQVVTSTQVNTMSQIAQYVKQHPDAKIIVSGFADQNTGTIDANNLISRERAVNVANMLIRKYNVAYKNIYVKWYGGGIQPYLKASKNRLVIVRTPNAKVTLAEPEPVKAAPQTTTANPVVTQPEATEAVKDEGGLFLTVHFAETVAAVTDQKQENTIIKTALYLRRHPEAKIAISGYADKSNGSKDKDNILSKQRATNVANALIQRYSIATDRIQVKWYGATEQTYTKPSMNRLVLIETTTF